MRARSSSREPPTRVARRVDDLPIRGSKGADRPVAAEQQPLGAESGRGVVDVRLQSACGPVRPVGLGDQSGELRRDVVSSGERGQLRRPRLPSRRGNRRLGEVIDHEAAVGYLAHRACCGVELMRQDQQFVARVRGRRPQRDRRPRIGARASPGRARTGRGCGCRRAMIPKAAPASGRADPRRRAAATSTQPTTPATSGVAAARSRSSSVSATSATVCTTTLAVTPLACASSLEFGDAEGASDRCHRSLHRVAVHPRLIANRKIPHVVVGVDSWRRHAGRCPSRTVGEAELGDRGIEHAGPRRPVRSGARVPAGHD